MGQVIRTKDGRKLAVEHYGNPRGRPVFLLHGTPGSRLGPHRAARCCTAWGCV